MLAKCPICGARGPGPGQCRRCGSELDGLHRIQRQGQDQERRAVAALLVADNRIQAMTHLDLAMILNATPLAMALRGFLRHSADADVGYVQTQ